MSVRPPGAVADRAFFPVCRAPPEAAGCDPAVTRTPGLPAWLVLLLDYQEPPMPNRPTILFSLAHPDDESFMVAGVACKYGARGVRLVLATATLGDAGKVGDPPVCSRKELPG